MDNIAQAPISYPPISLAESDEPLSPSTVLNWLADGAGDEIKSEGMGWLMNSVLGIIGGPPADDLATLQAQLTSLNIQMNAVISGLANISHQLADLAEQGNFNTLVAEVNPLQNEIQSNLQTLTALGNDSGPSASSTSVINWGINSGWTALTGIHNAIITGNSIAAPGQFGLVRMYADKCAEACIQDGFSRGSFATGGLLDKNYADLENYFSALISLQVQGMTLVTNALNGSNEIALAQAQLGQFQANIAAQCEEFLWAVESYVVTVCQDDSLLDLFRASASNCDPLRQADAFVDQYIYPPAPIKSSSPTLASTFRTRIWGGTSSDQSLSTTNFVPLQNPAGDGSGRESGSAVPLTMSPGESGPALIPTASTHTVFPLCGTRQWSLYRHSWMNLPAGNYTMAAPYRAPNASFITLIDSYSTTAAAYGSTISLPPLSWTIGVAADTHQVEFTTRTNFQATGASEQTVTGIYNFVSGYTMEAWVKLQTAAGSPITIVLTGRDPNGNSAYATFGISVSSDWVVNADINIKSNNGGYYNTNTSGSLASTLGNEAWHHIAATLNGAGNITVYIDGSPISMSSKAGTASAYGGAEGIFAQYGSDWSWTGGYAAFASPQLQAIGSEIYVNQPSINGCISEVRLWNVANTQAQIQSYMRRRAVGTEPELTGAWSLDTGAATNRVNNVTNATASGIIIAAIEDDWLALPSGATWATTPSS